MTVLCHVQNRPHHYNLEESKMWIPSHLNYDGKSVSKMGPWIVKWPHSLVSKTIQSMIPDDHNQSGLGLHDQDGSVSGDGIWELYTVWENSVCSNLYSNHPIRLQFCTCHDSSAAVPWAKFKLDWIIISNARAGCHFTRFGLRAHKPCDMVPNCTVVLCYTLWHSFCQETANNSPGGEILEVFCVINSWSASCIFVSGNVLYLTKLWQGLSISLCLNRLEITNVLWS